MEDGVNPDDKNSGGDSYNDLQPFSKTFQDFTIAREVFYAYGIGQFENTSKYTARPENWRDEIPKKG